MLGDWFYLISHEVQFFASPFSFQKHCHTLLHYHLCLPQSFECDFLLEYYLWFYLSERHLRICSRSYINISLSVLNRTILAFNYWTVSSSMVVGFCFSSPKCTHISGSPFIISLEWGSTFGLSGGKLVLPSWLWPPFCAHQQMF